MAEDTQRQDDDRRLKVLLTQYEQAWSHIRVYDQMIWQTPTISLAVVAFLVGALFQDWRRMHWLLIVLVLAFAFAIAMVGMIQLRKHRFHQIARTIDMRRLHEQIRAMRGVGPDLPPIFFRTEDIRANRYTDDTGLPNGVLDRQSAFRSLNWLMCLVVLALAVAMILVFLLRSNVLCLCTIHPR